MKTQYISVMSTTWKKKLYLATGTSLMLLTASVSAASIVVFTSRAAWEVAVSGNFQTENFNSLPAAPLTLGLNEAGLIDIRVNNSVGQNQFGFGGQFIGETISQIGRTQDLVFPTAIFGFAGDWTDTTTNSLLLTIIGGETIQFDNFLPGSGSGFLGFVSDTPFLEARISDEGISGNEVYFLDNLSFSAVAVPEPGSLALLALGIAGVALNRRRQKA